ncbi:MAG: metal ABC transporter ATP-binding protein [bacterium]
MAVIHMNRAVVGHPGVWQLGPIDLTVERGAFWGVVGPNGAGKTTLLRSLVGLHPLISGTCSLDQGAERRGGVSYVPQRDALDSIFPVTALNVAMMGLVPSLGFGRPFVWQHRRRALESLDRVGLLPLANKPFRQLSGGEQQRILIARATVSEPAVMLLDEPTAAMDVDAEREVLDLIDRLAKRESIAVLMVSHSLLAVRQHAERVILLNRERQRVRVGTPDEIIGTAAEGDQTFRVASSMDIPAAPEDAVS